ncbi:MAG: hypothetical protein UY63_C0004G0005 [Parcubacteria group bacterium GW2011_GWA2_51_10]|nr:MAG: hypothetical protein UY63_C0004G0005 [Parcubacteria group bacterium GW2011_GWA2_51_10]
MNLDKQRTPERRNSPERIAALLGDLLAKDPQMLAKAIDSISPEARTALSGLIQLAEEKNAQQSSAEVQPPAKTDAKTEQGKIEIPADYEPNLDQRRREQAFDDDNYWISENRKNSLPDYGKSPLYRAHWRLGTQEYRLKLAEEIRSRFKIGEYYYIRGRGGRNPMKLVEILTDGTAQMKHRNDLGNQPKVYLEELKELNPDALPLSKDYL